jgi:hypothetical protein
MWITFSKVCSKDAKTPQALAAEALSDWWKGRQPQSGGEQSH